MKQDIEKQKERDTFKGSVPYWAHRDTGFMRFFYQRDEEVKELMPDTHKKVVDASRGILNVDHYPYMDEGNFTVCTCPVRVKVNGEYDHPIFLAYCTWGKYSQMLYWSMDMIPLTNEEREQVWNDFVKDDEVYYEKSVNSML